MFMRRLTLIQFNSIFVVFTVATDIQNDCKTGPSGLIFLTSIDTHDVGMLYDTPVPFVTKDIMKLYMETLK